MALLNTRLQSRQTLISNTRKLSNLCVALVVLLASVYNVYAHESAEIRIQQLEHQLDHMSPGSAEESVALMLHRADLYRRQMNWDAALQDYRLVADKEPDNQLMLLGRSQLHLDQHQYLQAVSWSSRLLSVNPVHALAGLLHARALAGIGNFDTAAIVFGSAISRLDKPRPEHYIEYAQSILAAKSNSDTAHEAVAILDRGAKALGHPVSLHDSAYKIELNSGRREAALHRIEKVLTRNSSLLNWRLQRAELLMELGRSTEAHSETLHVIERIRQLPEHRRNSPAFQVMKKRVENVVKRVNAKDVN